MRIAYLSSTAVLRRCQSDVAYSPGMSLAARRQGLRILSHAITHLHFRGDGFVEFFHKRLWPSAVPKRGVRAA